MGNDIVLRPSYWASVSGGKDSLYMLMLILSQPERYPLDGVVHFELEIDFPFIKDVVNLMREKCEMLGIPFVSIRPNVSWYTYYEKWGIPTRRARWCNSPYKMDAKKQLQNFLKTRGEKLISYIGYCADEVNRFKDDGNIYPLAENNIVESTILEWAKTEPIFNDYYKYNDRCGCMYCPMSSMQRLSYMYVFYPDNYNWFMNACKETEATREKELGRKFSIWQTNTKYDTKYYDHRIRTVYVPKLLEQIRQEHENK